MAKLRRKEQKLQLFEAQIANCKLKLAQELKDVDIFTWISLAK